MRTRSAIFYGPNQPIRVEDVELEGPKTGEVLVRVVAAGACHSDYHAVDGHINARMSPTVWSMRRRRSSKRSDLESRDSRVVVMGTEGTLYSEQGGPNTPAEQVTMGSKNGQPLEPLKRPQRLTPFTDDRDPRLMAFRLLVRDFNRGIKEGISPAPSFTDALRCQEALDAIRESSETGKTVKVTA